MALQYNVVMCYAVEMVLNITKLFVFLFSPNTCTLEKHVGCFNHRVLALVAIMSIGYERY